VLYVSPLFLFRIRKSRCLTRIIIYDDVVIIDSRRSATAAIPESLFTFALSLSMLFKYIVCSLAGDIRAVRIDSCDFARTLPSASIQLS